MWFLYSTGILALLTQALGWYGIYDQLCLNKARRSVEGLSLAESECRVWGKLPWILYVASLPSLDWPLLIANCAGILLGSLTLIQFLLYQDTRKIIDVLRTCFQFLLVGLTFLAACSWNNFLRAGSEIVAFLPVLATVLSLVLGNCCQFLKNKKAQTTQALSKKRYSIFFASCVLWFCYSVVKGTTLGWENAWSISVGASVGMLMNGIILCQIFSYGKKKIEPIAEQASLVPSLSMLEQPSLS